MIDPLVVEYGDAVAAFVASPDEAARERAYELGRTAIQRGLGVLDVSRIHSLALEARPSLAASAMRAWQFFAEVLAPFEMALRGVRDANATLKRFNELLEDRVSERTTELRATERQLREQTEVLRSVLDAMADGVLVADANENLTLTNRAADVLLGGATSDPERWIRGVTIFEDDERTPLPPDARPLRRALRGEVIREIDVFLQRESEPGRHARISAAPLRDDAHAITGAVLVVRDTTERKHAEEAARRAEERLTRAQKLDAIGQLAGGVAHDFNNLLAVILSYCGLLIDDLAPDDPHRADLLEVQQAATSAATLTRQLLAFSRQQVLALRPIDLNDIVEDVARMLRRTLGEHIDLETMLDKDVGLVLADRGQMEQVLMNLAVNARDAMPRGGKLTIETAMTAFEEGDEAATRSSVAPGRYVVLSVTDTGTGMDEATKARAFEPFFTTKERGRGTGLGLATVYGIVQQSGGSVTVYSEVGRGTTLRVYLPLWQGERESDDDKQQVRAARGDETVLLVEDDERLRVVATRALRSHGYRVLPASTPSEARRISRAHEGRIEILVSDIVMPEVAGTALAEELVRERPDMRVLFTSGYAAGGALRSGTAPRDAAFLEKPFTAESLRAKVRAVLDR